jgi:hypothetical protein
MVELGKTLLNLSDIDFLDIPDIEFTEKEIDKIF